MSKPTVTVVVRRIHSLLDQKSEILESVKDKFEELLSSIKKLKHYLDHADENKVLTETTTRFENKSKKFIYKAASESRESSYFLRRFLVQMANESEDENDDIVNKVSYERSFLGRFLVQMAHESEDVIDDIIVNTVAYERSGRYGFIKKHVCRPCFQIAPQQIQKIEAITKKLNEAKIIYVLEPKQIQSEQRLGYTYTQKIPSTTSHPQKIVGLQKVINSLLQKIIWSGESERILYIVGTAGSGKTTVATELSNQQDIKVHFKSVVWASVSEKKDAKSIFLEILRNTQGKEEDAKSNMITEELVNKICNILKERPCLIILDDVEDPDNLSTHLFRMIQGLNSKSKLVITTRATLSNPYKDGEYTVRSSENADSLAQKLTAKMVHESSIFYMLANHAAVLLLDDLFTDPRVKVHFNARKWVPIEIDGLDDRSILLDILNEVDIFPPEEKFMINTRHRNENLNVDELTKRLKDFLAKPPNLIVLDQVQKVESLAHRLHSILDETNHKNKIIIITNNLPTELQQNENLITIEDFLDDDHLVRRLTGEGEQPCLFSIRDLDGSGSNKDLARQLYNHAIVEQHFEHKNWITIPKKRDAEDALRLIISQTTGNTPSIQESKKKLIDVLLGELEAKKHLLVIDGMGEDLVCDLLAAQSTKARIKKIFLPSKIIITVGNPRTFKHSNLKYALYEMQPLPEKESWDLLCSIAFSHAKSRPSMDQTIDQFNRKSNGEMIKRSKMLNHCNGIPLAIVILGGLLRTKETVEEWETVSTSLDSEERRSDQALENILLFSYHDLPDDIMPCFLYFSLFPPHSEISTGLLIRMWLSEGLVTSNPQSGIQKTLENVAALYLEELACRCLIQVVRRNHVGEIKTIYLHDKVHQVSITKSAELGFLDNYPHTQDKPLLQPATHSRGDVPQTREMHLRRTAIHPGKFNTYPTQSLKLRTLVQFGKHGLSVKQYYFQHDTLLTSLEPIHRHFKLLRVLILCGIRIRTLPEQVGELTFLTYLGLRATGVLELPKTIGNLRQLITLDYVGTLKPSFCKQLPNVLCHMTRLRHVYLPAHAISSMGKLDLSTLQNLQILWGVSGGDWLTDDLGKINASLLKLGIVKISCTKELEAVVNWLNREPKQLQVLKLDWHGARQCKLLFPENLKNCQNLHKLAFIGRLKEEYNFTLLPSLVKLELYFSHLEKYDPTEKLGQLPLLKILCLWNAYKGIQWNCGSNMFLKLEELQISHLPNLVQWRIEAGAMPHLRRLTIFSCQKLLALPEGLRYINLQELEILDMPKSFSSRLHEIKDENTAEAKDIDIIRNIPCIKIEASTAS